MLIRGFRFSHTCLSLLFHKAIPPVPPILPALLSVSLRRYTRNMPQRSSKKKDPRDINEPAFDVVRELTSEEPPEEGERQKNPAAVMRGKLGGPRGGKTRAAKLSK